MKIGLLVIGNELLQGKISDLNTPWLARWLAESGSLLESSLIVGDGLEDIQQALGFLRTRCDTLVLSGGLGPTADDVTKRALAEAFRKPVEWSAEARAVAAANYQRQGRELPEGHCYQELPRGFRALNNPSGFAPGLLHQEAGLVLMALPGVPKEFRDMIRAHLPALLPKSAAALRLLSFRTRGIPEEKIFSELCPTLWSELARFGEVSSLPHTLSVDVGVKVSAATEAQADELGAQARELVVRSALAPYLWHVGPEALEEVIVAAARAGGLRFAFAESCTGGLCSHRLTNVSGVSEVFAGSVVSYANEVKTSQLAVAPELLREHGAVSTAVAEAMARGARGSLGVDVAIAITGIAGPGGGSSEKPVGTVCFGVASPRGVRSLKKEFKGDRETLKLRFSQIALFELLDELRASGKA